jgi:site-specific DNA-adenine methylase
MPEEQDLEEYLEKIKKRWQSSLLSEEQNKKIRNKWDDTWMIGETNAQEQGISSNED